MKLIKKECCTNDNKVISTKSPTYREIICKKCGYIYSIHEVSVYES